MVTALGCKMAVIVCFKLVVTVLCCKTVVTVMLDGGDSVTGSQRQSYRIMVMETVCCTQVVAAL